MKAYQVIWGRGPYRGWRFQAQSAGMPFFDKRVLTLGESRADGEDNAFGARELQAYGYGKWTCVRSLARVHGGRGTAFMHALVLAWEDMQGAPMAGVGGLLNHAFMDYDAMLALDRPEQAMVPPLPRVEMDNMPRLPAPPRREDMSARQRRVAARLLCLYWRQACLRYEESGIDCDFAAGAALSLPAVPDWAKPQFYPIRVIGAADVAVTAEAGSALLGWAVFLLERLPPAVAGIASLAVGTRWAARNRQGAVAYLTPDEGDRTAGRHGVNWFDLVHGEDTALLDDGDEAFGMRLLEGGPGALYDGMAAMLGENAPALRDWQLARYLFDVERAQVDAGWHALLIAWANVERMLAHKYALEGNVRRRILRAPEEALRTRVGHSPSAALGGLIKQGVTPGDPLAHAYGLYARVAYGGPDSRGMREVSDCLSSAVSTLHIEALTGWAVVLGIADGTLDTAVARYLGTIGRQRALTAGEQAAARAYANAHGDGQAWYAAAMADVLAACLVREGSDALADTAIRARAEGFSSPGLDETMARCFGQGAQSGQAWDALRSYAQWRGNPAGPALLEAARRAAADYMRERFAKERDVNGLAQSALEAGLCDKGLLRLLVAYARAQGEAGRLLTQGERVGIDRYANAVDALAAWKEAMAGHLCAYLHAAPAGPGWQDALVLVLAWAGEYCVTEEQLAEPLGAYLRRQRKDERLGDGAVQALIRYVQGAGNKAVAARSMYEYAPPSDEMRQILTALGPLHLAQGRHHAAWHAAYEALIIGYVDAWVCTRAQALPAEALADLGQQWPPKGGVPAWLAAMPWRDLDGHDLRRVAAAWAEAALVQRADATSLAGLLDRLQSALEQDWWQQVLLDALGKFVAAQYDALVGGTGRGLAAMESLTEGLFREELPDCAANTHGAKAVDYLGRVRRWYPAPGREIVQAVGFLDALDALAPKERLLPALRDIPQVQAPWKAAMARALVCCAAPGLRQVDWAAWLGLLAAGDAKARVWHANAALYALQAVPEALFLRNALQQALRGGALADVGKQVRAMQGVQRVMRDQVAHTWSFLEEKA